MRDLSGRVVVVAGTEPTVAPMAAALQQAGAMVALVADAADIRAELSVHFRADPSDAETWARVSIHVEQHLGPIDAVVTDASAETHARAAFGDDLRRRGHGDILVVAPADEPGDVVRRVAGTQ